MPSTLYPRTLMCQRPPPRPPPRPYPSMHSISQPSDAECRLKPGVFTRNCPKKLTSRARSTVRCRLVPAL